MPGLGLGLASGLPGNAHSRTTTNEIACNAKIKYDPCNTMGRYTENGDLTAPLWPVNPHLDYQNQHWICRMLRGQNCAQNAKSHHKTKLHNLIEIGNLDDTRNPCCMLFVHSSRSIFRLECSPGPQTISPSTWFQVRWLN
jgi:hypothetical protein